MRPGTTDEARVQYALGATSPDGSHSGGGGGGGARGEAGEGGLGALHQTRAN